VPDSSSSVCPQCGNPALLSSRCDRCGYNMSKPAARLEQNWLDARLSGDREDRLRPGARVASPQQASVPAAGGPRSSAVVLAVLAVLMVPVAAWWFTRPELARSGVDPPLAVRTDSPSATPRAQANKTRTNENGGPATTRCWVGRKDATRPGCPPLSGDEALAWVFSGIGSGSSDCGIDPDHDQTLWISTRLCRVRVPGSGTASVHYAQVADVDAGRRTYDGLYSTRREIGEGSLVDRYEWTDEEAARWATIYADHPWAVSVEASSAEDLDYVLRRVVKLRPSAVIKARSGG
jgi:hypothetical protein